MTTVYDERRRMGVGPAPAIVGVGDTRHFARPGEIPAVGFNAMQFLSQMNGPAAGGPARRPIPNEVPVFAPQREGRGLIQSVGDMAKEWGPLVLAGLAAYEGHQSGKKQEEMVERAIREQEERKAMVRRGRERRAALPPTDHSDTFASDNPYRRRIPSVGGG